MPRRKLSKGMSAVITGASTGIGRALALHLAKRYQANLVINARTEAALEETRRGIVEQGGKAEIVAGDLADRELARHLVQTCVDRFKSIDLLVNNAGLAKPGPITKITPQDWEHVFSVNFFAPLYGIYAALPYFLEKGEGKIVNISSVAAKISFPGSVCYAASKFALSGMSEGMAAELGGKGIDVITVCPGWVRTEFFLKNSVDDQRNPTLIAARNDLPGLIMRYLLSISSEECASEIVSALDKGGSHELIMTLPGAAVERIKALFPQATAALLQHMPMKLADPSKKQSVNQTE